MRPSLHPRLVNGPFEDPALFIQFLFENRAILFDLGDIHALSTRDILKLCRVFVTHTHMDHFVGFDRLLRLFLGRNKRLAIYGPQGFLKNVESKLGAYQWNLVKNFSNDFSLQVFEIRHDVILSQTYACRQGFQPARPPAAGSFSSRIVSTPAFTVDAQILDHRIPCLGYSIKERFHINIKKDALQRLGLSPGPWVTRFKQALYNQADPQTLLEIPFGNQGGRQAVLGDLTEQLAVITPGQKISYIADVGYQPENAAKLLALARNSDHLFLEAAFMHKHAHIAAEKYHLTARQAGELAARAHVKRFTPFHFSPRYANKPEAILAEAMRAYHGGENG
jgi:ribonuclease Z